ncbi:MAG: hypothetical protein V7K35_24640 [Nostoc sp.]|uniref:hypothetical protein n=1 Tax=Nostoc sp. TaxID=1180 RepID=UPI002FF64F9E
MIFWLIAHNLENLLWLKRLPSLATSLAFGILCLCDRSQNLNFQPLNSEVRPFCSNVEPLNSEVRPFCSNLEPLNSEVRPFYSNVEPLNSEVAPFCSNLEPLNSEVVPFCSNVELLKFKFRVLRLKLEGIRLDDGD